MSEIGIAIVVSPRDWAERLHRFLTDHGGARVRRRVVSRQDAFAGDAHIVVVDDLTSFLTVGFVDEAHRRGRAVLGVFDPGEPWGRERLSEVGVDDTIPSDSEAEEFLRTFEVLAAGSLVDRGTGSVPTTGASDPVTPTVTTQVDRGRGQGVLIAVGGPSGGTGKTEVAIGLTHALAATSGSAVLVDGDTIAPSVAQRLGLALHPNLRTAVDAVEHRGGSIEDCLAQTEGSLAVFLAGLAASADWLHLHPDEIAAVVDRLRALHRFVVVDVGVGIEDVPTAAGGRFAVQRAFLQAADAAVIVSAPTPVGLTRALTWAADLRDLAPAVPMHVAVNRVPAGRFRRGEIESELTRTLPVPSLGLVREDRRVAHAAWEGRMTGRGPFMRAVGSLAQAVARRPVEAAP